MSIASISSSLFNHTPQVAQNNSQNLQKEFQQLGQDLQSGNLSAAQSDFATLQKDEPQSSISEASQSSPIAQAFSQLAKDLQSGNLSAAQQDYSSIPTGFQKSNDPGAHGRLKLRLQCSLACRRRRFAVAIELVWLIAESILSLEVFLRPLPRAPLNLSSPSVVIRS